MASFAGGGDRKVCLKSQEPRHSGASSRTRVNSSVTFVKYESSNQVERLAIFAGGGESRGFGLRTQARAKALGCLVKD